VKRELQTITLSVFFVAAGLILACEREERGFRVNTPDSNRINSKELTTFQAGEMAPTPVSENDYEKNAFALSQGKQLFSQMNCTGCHAHGGGGIGPPLMDDKWIYGSQPDQIFATIVEGRPNGMPSFRNKLPDYQVWQLAAYVRSMSGQAPKDAAPGRDDDLQMKTPENSTHTEKPKSVAVPKSAEAPQ
jgi:cytochrome c oxidase cbb3-type subunit 3